MVFWSLSCYKELKLTTNWFTGRTLRGLPIQMQNISLRSSGMRSVAENIVGSLCVSLAESFVLRHLVFAPIRNTKKLPNKQKEITTKTRSPAKAKASLADIFSFSPQYGARSQATKLRMRPPKQSTKHFDNHFNPVSRAILKWRIGNLKKPPGFEQD